MTKQIKLLFILCLLFTTPLYAKKLNILHNNPSAKIFINGQPTHANTVYNYEVESGSHHIQVKLDNNVIYSDIVHTNQNETITIDTNTFVGLDNKSEVLDIGPESEELKRLRKNRGSVAIGTQFSSISGLSFKKYFGSKIGIQLAGWYSDSDEKNYYKSISTRLIWNISEKLLKVDSPVTLFTGIGYGYKSYASDLSTSGKTRSIDTVYELLLGIEARSKIGYFTFGTTLRHLNSTYDEIRYNYDDFFSYDETLHEDLNSKSTGIRLNIGYHYYF